MRNCAALPQIRAVLEPLANAARAQAIRVYLRNPFEFLGISTPDRRAATAPILRGLCGRSRETLVELARRLRNEPQREFQYVAIDLLARTWISLLDAGAAADPRNPVATEPARSRAASEAGIATGKHPPARVPKETGGTGRSLELVADQGLEPRTQGL
jgi:hypothetical protein